MHTRNAGSNLQITLLRERMSFKDFAVTLQDGDWPDVKRVVDACETGYQYADIKFFPHEKKAYVKVYTD